MASYKTEKIYCWRAQKARRKLWLWLWLWLSLRGGEERPELSQHKATKEGRKIYNTDSRQLIDRRDERDDDDVDALRSQSVGLRLFGFNHLRFAGWPLQIQIS